MSRLLAWQYPSAVHMRTFSVSCTTVSLNMSLNHFQTSCSCCTFAYVWSAVVPKVVGKLLGPVANADEPLADRAGLPREGDHAAGAPGVPVSCLTPRPEHALPLEHAREHAREHRAAQSRADFFLRVQCCQLHRLISSTLKHTWQRCNVKHVAALQGAIGVEMFRH